MKKEQTKENIEEINYSNMVYNNSILLSLDCWIKFIEGFVRGLQSTEKVNTSSVLDCIGEILEFINSFKTTLVDLLNHCESILQENNDLRDKLKKYESIINEEELDGKDM